MDKRTASSSSLGSSIAQTVQNVGTIGSNSDNAAVSELLGRDQGIQDMIFSALHLASRENYEGISIIAVLKVLFEFLQMLVFLLSADWDWDIKYRDRLYPWFRRAQLNWIIVEKGYDTYKIAIFFCAGAIAALIGAFAFFVHEFKANRIARLQWAVRLCAIPAFLIFDFFYISALSFFLHATDCLHGYNPTKLAYTRGYSHYFVGQSCTQMPHVAMLAVGATAATAIISIGLMLAVNGGVTKDYVAPPILSTAQAETGIRILIFKTIIAIFAMNIQGEKQLQSIIIFICFSYILWVFVRRVPHFNTKILYARAASFGVLAWTSLMLLLRVYGLGVSKGDPKTITLAMFLTMPIGLVIGLVAMKLRLRAIRRNTTRNFFIAADPDSQPGQAAEINFRFFDDIECEAMARLCLERDRRGRVQESTANAAEEALKLGMKQFPESAFLTLAYSGFMATVRQNMVIGSAQLTKAAKMPLGFTLKFRVFVRTLEEKSKSNQKTGDGAMDLASYVEFQQNFKVLMAAHTAALKAVRHFWREMLRSDVTFQHLTRALNFMDISEAKADRTFQMIIERYPKSVKVLRNYGKYLEEIKHDPWGGNRYYTEADRLEDLQAEADREAMLSRVEGQEGGAMTAVDDSTDAVVVINDVGIIQFTNKVLIKMFGYKLGELEGKNVSCLMPAPFSTQHNTFLRNYKVTAKAKILNRTRDVIALHKDRHVMPIKLTVTKVSQGEQDGFMAVVRPVEEDFKHGLVWVTTSGQVLCCNRGFTDLFGFRSVDLVGRNIKQVAVSPEDMEAHIIEAADLSKLFSDDEPDEQMNKSHAKFTTMAKHKFGASSFNVDVDVQFAGTQSMRILVLKMATRDNTQGIIAVDSNGMIQYSSYAVDTMLGYDPGSLGGGVNPLAKVLPMPYAALHLKFTQDFSTLAASGMNGAPKPTSCVTGRVVSMAAKGGRIVPVRLRISLLKEGDDLLYAANVAKVAIPAPNGWGTVDVNDLMLEHARVRLLVRNDGRIIASDAPMAGIAVAEPAFGLRREDLQGAMLSDLVDIFQGALQNARLFNASASAESVVGPFMERMAQRGAIMGIAAWKVGLALGNAGVAGRGANTLTPARMTIRTAASAGVTIDDLVSNGQLESKTVAGDLRSMAVLELFSVDALQGYLEVGKTGEIRRADQQASLILGSKSSIVEGRQLSQLLVGQMGSKVQDVLGLKLGKKIGERMVFDATHAEGDQIRVSMLSATKGDDGDRYVALLSIPPGSAVGGNVRRVQEIVQTEAAASAQARFAAGVGAADDDEDRRDMNVRFTGLRSRDQSTVGGPKKKYAGTIKGSETSSPPESVQSADDRTDRTEEDEEEERKLEVKDDDQRSVGSASEASSGTGMTGEFKRAKRYKRLMRLLATPRARKPVLDLNFRSKLLSWLAIAIHLTIFITSRVLLVGQTGLVSNVKNVGDTLRFMEASMISSRIIESVYNGSGHVQSEFNKTKLELLSNLQLFEDTIRTAFKYVLTKRFGSEAYIEYAVDLYPVDIWNDVVPMHYENSTMRAWDLFNVFIRKSRMVASAEAFPEWHSQMYNWRHFRFVMDNGPFNIHNVLSKALDVEASNAIANMKLLQNVLLALMCFEGILILPLFAGIMFITMRNLQTARIALFSVFLCVPRPAVLALANREINLDEDASDGDDELDDDTEWMKQAKLAEGEGAEGAAEAQEQPKKLMKIQLKKASDRRKLKSSNAWELIRVVTPFLVYTVLVLAIYGSSLGILNQTTRPLRDLISAEKLQEYATRLRFWAHELVLAHTVADQDWFRWRLQIAATLFSTLYHSLLYGTGAEYEGLDGADPSLKGSLFRNKAIQGLLFGKVCLRLPADQPCYSPTSPYYEISTNGLDTLISAEYDTALQLTQELPNALSLSNPKFSLIWGVGPKDMAGGLHRFTTLYVQDNFKPYTTIETLEIILLVAIILFNIGYMMTIVPFITRASRESKRVAQLMSLLPEDMDVETLVIEANGLMDDDMGPAIADKRKDKKGAKKGAKDDSDSDSEEEDPKKKKKGAKFVDHKDRKHRKVVPVGGDDDDSGSNTSDDDPRSAVVKKPVAKKAGKR